VLDVLNSDVDSLCQNPVLDTLVENDTDGSTGDVKDTSGLTVVDLVWHTLLHVTSTLNVNNVPDLVDGHTLGDSEFTSLTEVPCEHVPGTPSKTMCTTHDESV